MPLSKSINFSRTISPRLGSSLGWDFTENVPVVSPPVILKYTCSKKTQDEFWTDYFLSQLYLLFSHTSTYLNIKSIRKLNSLKTNKRYPQPTFYSFAPRTQGLAAVANELTHRFVDSLVNVRRIDWNEGRLHRGQFPFRCHVRLVGENWRMIVRIFYSHRDSCCYSVTWNEDKHQARF